MPRLPRPEDLFALRVPAELRVTPDGRSAVFALKSVAPGLDGYRSALWIVPLGGEQVARQLTLGAKSDTVPRPSPDGRWIAFVSDRGAVLQAAGAGDRPGPAEAPQEGGNQVWLLPLQGGEAQQLTRLPRDVSDIAWSPDSERLVVVSASEQAEKDESRRDPGERPERDIRLIDRLNYQLNGAGFIHDRVEQLWVVDVADGSARRLTRGSNPARTPAWSPDGRRIAFASDRRPDQDLYWRSDVYVVDADGGRPFRVTGGPGEQQFSAPEWSPDGASIAAIGHRFPAAGASRSDVWRFRVREEDDGENLTGESDRHVAATMNSDVLGAGDGPLHWSPGGEAIVFAAPVDGSYELWRVAPDGRERRVERLTKGRHYLSRESFAPGPDGALRGAAVRMTGHEPPDVVTLDVPRDGIAARGVPLRRLTDLMGGAWGDIELSQPVERWHEVDNRRIQGWYLAPTGGDRSGRPPLVLEIHGGPETLYGWGMFWEWQCLAAQGIAVYACNPRGSTGYGQAFTAGNFRDWGHGPMADVMGGVEALISDGLADPERLGVTGGSYGGYLTTWIVGHTDRFRAAVTARSVSDMTSQMLSGDLGGPQFGLLSYGANPWDDPELYRAASPLTYAPNIRTPLLIQHSERDLRTTITQAEELFSTLRSHRRPVRLMRVPDETHELTRSGTPFRRVDNLEIIVDWFRHFLVDGKRRLPPVKGANGTKGGNGRRA